MQPSTEFLTPEECAEVDRALMTAQDKFATRVAIYALRSLRQIAQRQGTSIKSLTPEQIEDWVYQDESLQNGMDREFKKFFSRLVSSSRNPLQRIAESAGVVIEQLTVPEVVKWFEQEARIRIKDGETPQ
jgi:hypothetical protein